MRGDIFDNGEWSVWGGGVQAWFTIIMSLELV